MNPYQKLAIKLDEFPNGYPPTESGVELKILEKLFTQEEASLAAIMMPELETPKDFALRTGVEMRSVYPTLKEMAKKGLIKIGRLNGRLAFALLPFVGFVIARQSFVHPGRETDGTAVGDVRVSDLVGHHPESFLLPASAVKNGSVNGISADPSELLSGLPF